MKKETAHKLLKFSEKEYDTYAQEFSDSRAYFWRELEFLRTHAKMERTVLDIGCGNGRLLDLFSDKHIHYTGIDSSRKLISIAKKHRGDRGTFVHGNALSLPFDDRSFDAVFSVAVLHHIPSREYRDRFIKEAGRVLEQKGSLILTVWKLWQWRFVRAHLAHLARKLTGRSDLDFGDLILSFGQQKKKRYVHAFTKRGLKRLLKENGFDQVSITEARRRSGYANYVVIARRS